ncbi:glycosyltransferase family 39 protein [Mesorhizobium sp. YC-39]|uniref:ArnT family glycosyltransferase n=1 Tax=unclassified Mesorhizobium TaxID=325217 RepID=UPI0021E9A95C|nr:MULTISPECIES: glycosyltransferase family 39 protein [unclassified Mesorhizobium]MCV3208817.1 glycosyltransferase family 39 protein [Mesorhizobium sp. YC-2]MCV3231834.1 glycosyltransferase family 39 protein [Mesorhizobium sp. YC-39]
MKYSMKWAEWLAEGRIGPFPAAMAMVALYCCIQIAVLPLVSLWAGTGVGVDDSEQLMYMRFLWAGYGGSQPPLYSWLGWLMSSVFGTSIVTLKILKYSLIFIGLTSVFIAVRKLGYSQRTAVASMFGLWLFPQVIWEMQHTLSHSVAALCLSGVLLLALVQLLQRKSLLAYVLFGVAVGAAILAKYNNFILIAAMLAATLSLREARQAILRPQIAISLIMALLVCVPTLYWNATHPGELLARSYKFGIDDGDGALLVALNGILDLGQAALNFAILPVVIFEVAMLAGRVVPSDLRERFPDSEKLVWRILGFGICITIILVLASGATRFQDRWLLPILLFLPVAFAVRMDALGDKGRTAQNLVITVAAALAILIVPGTWAYQVYGGKGQGRVVRLDYQTLYRGLTAGGAIKTVTSDWHWVGNLRLADPNLVVLGKEVPGFAALLQEPAVLVWLDKPNPEPEILERIHQAGFDMDGASRSLRIPEFFGSKDGRLVNVVRLKKQDAK